MAKPLVAIVGRPNVGKSTFFNKMAGRRISIVENKPGVTRDRIYADAEWCGKKFTMVDTGGIEVKSDDEMWKHIRRQAELAVELADVVLFFTDGKQGITADDDEVAKYLRKTGKPVVLAVNKVDTRDHSVIYEFYALGLGEPIPVSAEQSLNLGDLLDAIVEKFPKTEGEEESGSALKIAVVGKPNAGKSSLVNKILGFDRVIVSDVAGTTRDAVDTAFSYNEKEYILVDTAGIRRKNKVDEDVEYYSVVRAIAAIRKADIVLIVVDSSEKMTEQDVRICGLVHEAGKPSVIVMNKWDAVEKETGTMNVFQKKLKEDLKFMDYFRPVFISAKTGQRVPEVLKAAEASYENSARRITTGTLNEVIQDAVAVNEPPSYKGRRLKVLYATQVASNPPSFVLFVNDSELVHFSYKRYLENSLRKAFDFTGTPVRIIIRNKDQQN